MSDSFPYLNEDEEIQFPSPDSSTPEGIIASGGNLSPGCLLSAYKQGIFPWFSEDDPIMWWSPDPRFLLFPKDLHISKSMNKIIKKNEFTISFDKDFEDVINYCSKIKRPDQPGTWITNEMINAYIKMFELGWAHSVEVWKDEKLVGGLYGLSIGRFFAGESMFSLAANASKLALINLVWYLEKRDFLFIDCQVFSEHLETLGARDIPRKDFFKYLDKSLRNCNLKESWN